MGKTCSDGVHHDDRAGQRLRPGRPAPSDTASLKPMERAIHPRLLDQRAAVPRPLLAGGRHRDNAGLGRCRHAAVVALGRCGGRTRDRPHRACRPRAHRTPRLEGGAPPGTSRSLPADRGAASLAHPVDPRAVPPGDLVPPRRATVPQPPLRRSPARSPPRRVHQPTPAAGRARADLPARRRVPHRQQDARRPAAAVQAREPRLGMCERELPPFSTRLVWRPSDRRQPCDRLGPRARSGVRRRPVDSDPGRRVGRRAPGRDCGVPLGRRGIRPAGPVAEAPEPAHS